MTGADNSDPSNNNVTVDFSNLERVQDILDKNRNILYQIKANHDAQKPEGIAKNFALIREVNTNIDKVMQVYVTMSEEYVTYMRQNTRESGSFEPGSDANQPPQPAAQ